VVVALGILSDGRTVVLGLWQGSTENAVLCTSLRQDLLERGLRINGKVLCVIDGGRGLRRALSDVLGDLAVVQRCVLHSAATCSPICRKAVMLMWRARSRKPGTAIRRNWCAGDSRLSYRGWSATEDSAAASLRESLEETLSVLKFDLPASLRGFLLTTNAIENLIGSVRRGTRNVTRWRSGDMIACWSAVGLSNAEPNFPRIRGYRHLPILARALHHDAVKIDQTEEAA
jgi:transposase-like protein